MSYNIWVQYVCWLYSGRSSACTEPMKQEKMPTAARQEEGCFNREGFIPGPQRWDRGDHLLCQHTVTSSILWTPDSERRAAQRAGVQVPSFTLPTVLRKQLVSLCQLPVVRWNHAGMEGQWMGNICRPWLVAITLESQLLVNADKKWAIFTFQATLIAFPLQMCTKICSYWANVEKTTIAAFPLHNKCSQNHTWISLFIW